VKCDEDCFGRRGFVEFLKLIYAILETICN